MRKPSPFVFIFPLFLSFILLRGQAQGQSCPITIKSVEPRAVVVSAPANSVPPYLKIIFHNDSAMTINRVVFEVHFSGAFGEFTATHAVPAAAGDLSVWSDAAFVREYGDALDLEVRAEKIVFFNGTTWLDDGSHTCSKLFSAAASYPHVPSQTVVVSGNSLAAIPAFTVKGQQVAYGAPSDQGRETADHTGKAPSTLLVPAAGNAPIADEAGAPIQPAVFTNIHSGPPLTVENESLDIELPWSPFQPRLLPLRGVLICPVVAEYLDIGGEGRIYSAILNQSDQTVNSVQVTVVSGESRQTIKDSAKLLPGARSKKAWQTQPALSGAADTSLQVEKVVFSDGKSWSNASSSLCIVSSNRQTAADRTSIAATPTPAAQQPSSALPLIVRGANAPQTPAVGATAQPSIQHAATTAVPGPGATSPATAQDSSVNEEATPDSMRRYAPLIAEKKASICTVTTTPPGATVSLDGKRLGESPLVFVMLRKDQARQLTLSLPGYHNVEYQLFPDGNPVPLTVRFAAKDDHASGQ